jgi:hypothetical protein
VRIFVQTLVAALAVCIPTVPALSGEWVALGEGACGVAEWAVSYADARPDPDLCTAQSNGLAVICYDSVRHKFPRSYPGPACLYKRATPTDCRGGEAPGEMYRCSAPPLAAGGGAAADCSMRADGPWQAAGAGYSIAIVVDGATCDAAVALVTLRRPDGLAIWGAWVAVRDNLYFQDGKARADVATAIRRMVSQLGAAADGTTCSFPDWPAGGEIQGGTDFHWQAKPGMTRGIWQDLREAGLPTLVFATGQETSIVLVLERDGSLREVASVSQR